MKVYVVMEHWDNGEDYEDHWFTDDVEKIFAKQEDAVNYCLYTPRYINDGHGKGLPAEICKTCQDSLETFEVVFEPVYFDDYDAWKMAVTSTLTIKEFEVE